MNWASDFTKDAERDLRQLPKNAQSSVARVLLMMESDPLQGNVKALHGAEWKGVFRRPVGGAYRLLFSVNHATRTFLVLRILRRSESTYD
jgi:mRNA-degrading endonuclease RelE of RelBE toxin-antitoxin system